MGALLLGYISSKTVFFLVAGAVAVAVLGYMFSKHYTQNRRDSGDGIIKGSDRSLFSLGPLTLSNAYTARAYATSMNGLPGAYGLSRPGIGSNYDNDTDINNVRTEIMNTLSTSTDDKNMLHTYMPQILAEINQACQRGGPLWQTIDDRKKGHIDHNNFHLKIANYCHQLANRHHIRMHGSGIGHGYGPYQGHYSNINNLINMMQRKKGFQYKYPWPTDAHTIPYAPPAVTPTYPAYPKPYQNFGDISTPEPGLCNSNQRYNYCLGKCVPYDSPIPDTCHPDLQGRVYGTY